jgi:hypothetical protein
MIKSILTVTVTTFQYLIIASVVIAIFAFPTMILWNLTIPSIFNGPFIAYEQMFFLMLLTRLLLPTTTNQTINQPNEETNDTNDN